MLLGRPSLLLDSALGDGLQPWRSIHPSLAPPHTSHLRLELSQLIGTESQADISSSSQAISSLPFLTHHFF